MTSKSNNKPYKDPYAKRESAKYENPIPSREMILKLIVDSGQPLNREDIALQLGLEGDEPLEALRRRLRAMERDGQLLFNRRRCYCPINSEDLIAGRIIGHADGFGFLKPDDGSKDLFLSPRQMQAVLHNDRAVAHVQGLDRRGRREGAIVEVLERNTQQIVGRFHKERGLFFVVPDNNKIAQDIIIKEEDSLKAKKGQIVVVELVAQPYRSRQLIGKVVEILGRHMAAGMEIDIAVRRYELPYQWPNAVDKQVQSMTEDVPEDAKQNRVDLRDTPLVTIDGADARDFDDAVYCKKTPSGWKLLVAIADVSHYVAINSPLDEEAKNRSTSVYFPENVIPMLPEILSNGLCSLKPEQDRLSMVCELLINHEGKVIRSRFFDAVIRSHARLTYTKVAKMLVDGDEKLRGKYSELMPHLDELYALYQVMRVERERRGTMDFDTQETQIIFGEHRKIEKIVPVVRNDAHRLIEEFMITANMAAARFLIRKKIPHLLRAHEGPNPEKLVNLQLFLNGLGLNLEGGAKPTPTDYMTLVRSIKGRADAHLIQTMLLRSLSQAVYSPESNGHFGLALAAYTHFTSPIRRYPDLLIHRAIRHCLQNKSVKDFHYSQADMVILGEHCSTNERRADEATRDVESWLKCEYMLDKVGEQFKGIISTVTSFGLFVELEDIYVEGLIHITGLGSDYFHFDAVNQRLVGENSGVSHGVGDELIITVAQVNLDDKKIDFMLAGSEYKNKKHSSKKVSPYKKSAKSDKDKKHNKSKPLKKDSTKKSKKKFKKSKK